MNNEQLIRAFLNFSKDVYDTELTETGDHGECYPATEEDIEMILGHFLEGDGK